MKKSITWIKEHLKDINIFRIVFYISTLFVIISNIVYGNLFSFEKLEKIHYPISQIFFYACAYIYFYLLVIFVFFIALLIENSLGYILDKIFYFFLFIYKGITFIFKHSNNTEFDINSYESISKNTTLLTIIKYLLVLIAIIFQ